jgi:hypothetical protein
MPLVVERSFEPLRDVMAGTEPRRRHRPGRSQAAASRTANEEKVVVQLDTERLQLVGKAFGKPRIHRLIGKGLPLDEDSPFAQGPQIGNPYISPLRAGAHVNQLRPRARLEAFPGRCHINLIDRVFVRMRAQNRAFSPKNVSTSQEQFLW